MKEFYYAQDWGTILSVPNVLLSYGVAYYKDRIRSFQKELQGVPSVFLDCGAYSFSKRNEPIDLDKYLDWIKSFTREIEYVATIDVMNNTIETVKSGIKCIEADPTINWVPVLQGNCINDYINCMIMYEDHGVPLGNRLVAIGGLKAKTQLERRLLLSKLSTLKLHGFGLTLNDLRHPDIWTSIYSADSGTWKKRPATTREKYSQLNQFKVDLETVRRDYNAQTILEGY